MTKPREYRAFTPEFLAYMHKHNAWPKDKEIIRWLTEKGRPKDRTFLSALRQGEFAPEPYAIALLEVMLDGARHPALAAAAERLVDYLRARGFALGHARDIELDSVVAHTCTQVSTGAPPRKLRKELIFDRVRRGLQDLANVPPKSYMRSSVCGVYGREQVEQAVRWVYLRLAQSRCEKGFLMDDTKAISAAADILGLGFDCYVRRAEQWIAASPWSVVFAKWLGKHKGTSILLPVTEAAYDAIRSGSRATYDVSFDEISVPSRFIVYEALAENPTLVRAPADDLTLPLIQAIAVQHGAIMRWTRWDSDSTYHFLAPAATPSNVDRMASTGFKPTGSITRSHGHPIWERVVDMSTGENLRPSEAFIIAWLSKHCETAPRPCRQVSRQ